eukprot:TRINITY_DN42045_c0_g1_i1.p1 TRINITY_DN42045_c0_g1~~TRINITY_DN42045_c0_g1_i1.p1  ORF type:complete len:812 (-),score=113.17 TRINITY_DN42045_c0_g1_i1:184-2619(-)
MEASGGPTLAPTSDGNGWEKLLEAQSEYIANLQRMLQSACQNAASLSAPTDPRVALPNGGLEDAGRGALLPPSNVSAGHPSAQVARASLQPADEGAGYALKRPPSNDAEGAAGPQLASNTSGLYISTGDCDLGTTAESGSGCAPSPHSALVPASGHELSQHGNGAAALYEDTANEVLRLRLRRSQHEELRVQLTKAEGQLRRLSPHAVFQLRSYLERSFRDANSASMVQEALIRLLESLCAVCHIEIGPISHVNLLNSVRKLFRDPHSFTIKLCQLPHVSSDEAKGLAPFLLHSAQYRRVPREKEVNDCYEAFHAWLSAFYLYSVVSDQVEETAQQLEKQEWMLRRLSQGGSAAAVPGPALQSAATASPVALVSPPVQASQQVASAASSSRGVQSHDLKSATAGRPSRPSRVSAAVASPVARGRASPQQSGGTRSWGVQRMTRPSPVGEQAGMGNSMQSRSPSPGTRASAGQSRRLNTSVSATPLRGSARRESYVHHPGDGAAGVALGPLVDKGTPLASPGAARDVPPRHSSPIHARRDSRSPSPGTGRASPAYPSQRLARPVGSERHTRSDQQAGGYRKVLSPSQSEGALPTANRMVSAPHRHSMAAFPSAAQNHSAQSSPRGGNSSRVPGAPSSSPSAGGAPSRNRVVSKTGTSSQAGPSSGRAIAHAAGPATAAANSGRGRGSVAKIAAARPMSPDKCGGMPRITPGETPESTCRSNAGHKDRASTGGDLSHASSANAPAASSGRVADSDAESDGEEFGPRRRQLSMKVYADLVRCAQQVVAVSTGGAYAPPAAATQVAASSEPAREC